MKPRVPSETAECRAFIAWTKIVQYAGEPLFERVVKIANERGKSGPQTAILTAMGMRKGFPDYVLLVPTRRFAGAYLEAKKIGGRTDPEQLAWRDRLLRFGYYAEVCEGAVGLIAAARDYLNTYGDPELWTDRTRAIT